MPYFGDTSSGPKIVDEVSKHYDRLYYVTGPGAGDTLVTASRLITSQQYRLTGLTESAATAAAGTSEDTVSQTTKSAQRTAADKQFQLRVTRDSWAAWTYDTEAIP